MSERRFTMTQINEAAEHAIGCVSAVLGDDPKFVGMVRNVTHMLEKTLEDLPVPKEFTRKVWVIRIDGETVCHPAGVPKFFVTQAQAKIQEDYQEDDPGDTIDPVTLTIREGHDGE